MIDNILIELLLLDGNETNFIDNAHTFHCFKELILELTKIKYNIRYCSNQNCICHPENTVKQLLKEKGLLSFLNEYCKKSLLIDIEVLVTNFKPIISTSIYRD